MAREVQWPRDGHCTGPASRLSVGARPGGCLSAPWPPCPGSHPDHGTSSLPRPRTPFTLPPHPVHASVGTAGRPAVRCIQEGKPWVLHPVYRGYLPGTLGPHGTPDLGASPHHGTSPRPRCRPPLRYQGGCTRGRYLGGTWGGGTRGPVDPSFSTVDPTVGGRSEGGRVGHGACRSPTPCPSSEAIPPVLPLL